LTKESVHSAFINQSSHFYYDISLHCSSHAWDTSW